MAVVWVGRGGLKRIKSVYYETTALYHLTVVKMEITSRIRSIAKCVLN